MPSEREVYRAALERIVELAAPQQLWHDLASAALAEGAALAENDTEALPDCKTCGCKYLATEQMNRASWTDKAKAAEARLAQIRAAATLSGSGMVSSSHLFGLLDGEPE